MKNAERIPAGRIVLGLVIVSGMLPLVAVAPGLALTLKLFGVDYRRKGKSYVHTTISRLKKNGYLVAQGEGKKIRLHITEAGKRYYYKKRIAMLYRPKKRPWDGYWRIVMFDIPESARSRRDALRRELAEVGFKQLQQSVWVLPDECEEYIKLLKADQHIGKKLIYLKTKDIEYGPALRSLFKVSKK